MHKKVSSMFYLRGIEMIKFLLPPLLVVLAACPVPATGTSGAQPSDAATQKKDLEEAAKKQLQTAIAAINAKASAKAIPSLDETIAYYERPTGSLERAPIPRVRQ
jgi:hypothetical protein